MHFVYPLFLLAIGVSTATPINLTEPYEEALSPDWKKLIEMAKAEEDVNSFVALECGKVVAEYYENDEPEIRHLFSTTKSFTGLLMGIMEKEGVMKLTMTLGEVWPEDEVWANVPDAEDRKKTTIEQIVQ